MPPSVAPDARVDASTEGARSSSPGACSAPLERWLTVASTWSRARISAGILAVSVCGSVVIVSGMSALFHGVVLGEYLVTGILTASLVSLVVAVVVTRLIAMLQQAERRATEASLAKSHFLANMSHEIRTPLNAILGMAEIIRRAGVSPDQLERLGTLERAGEHLLHIVDAILDLAKIEAGRFTLRVGGVRVEAVLANVASMLHDRAAARRVRIVTHVDAGIGRVLGDATRLQQAVLNYAGNALRFTEDGVVTLRALRLDGDADAVRVRFEVEDTGVGIEPAALARLFAPFEQVNNTATRSHGGTGLGLAITRRLAEMMGGEAGATSAPGVGSTFWFTARLARAHAPSDAPEVASPPEGAEATLRRTCAGRRVLVVEDEPVNREIARYLLAQVGLTVDEAHDGAEAVARACDGRYDLVLMDVQMPTMDGLEATRRIRAMSCGARLPVVAITANVFAEDKARGLAAGVDDFVTKPIDARAFFETVLRWLTRGRGTS